MYDNIKYKYTLCIKEYEQGRTLANQTHTQYALCYALKFHSTRCIKFGSCFRHIKYSIKKRLICLLPFDVRNNWTMLQYKQFNLSTFLNGNNLKIVKYFSNFLISALFKASTKHSINSHTWITQSHKAYAMDMDLFKQAAVVARQPPTKIQGYTLLPLIRYFIEISFPFFCGNYPDTYGNKYCMLS